MGLLSPVPLRPENRGYAPLFKVLNEIRTWLDSERIEPIRFKMVVGRSGLGFEISFRSEREAERFRERFASLLNGGRQRSRPPAPGQPRTGSAV
jgi:hypothetical protein